MTATIIGEMNKPLICVPLIGNNKEMILSELENVLGKKPDIIEWRADFFANIENTSEVIDLAKSIKEIVMELPVIFTIRSIREGGQKVPLSDRESIELNVAICERTTVEYVDCELSNREEDIQYLCELAHKYNKKVIASYHNFEFTPDKELLVNKLTEAEVLGLDVAKIAVMPKDMKDVLTLLSANLEAKSKLSIPLITMSMGDYGAVTRIVGGLFGSSLTFAVGQSSSAPGQIPIEDLQHVLEIVGKYTRR